MKMKVIDRILLGAYACISALALIFLLICAVSSGAAMALVNLGFGARIILSVLLAALISGAIYLVMLSFRPEGSEPASSASVQEGGEGSVRVSVRAMDTLARRAVEQTDGVLDSKLRIINHEDSVAIEVDIVIGVETHVPVVTALLQRNVKGIIEEFSGIAVREVVVLVTEIRNNAPAALPAPKDEQMKQVVIVPEHVEHTVEAVQPEEKPAEEAVEATNEEAPAEGMPEDAGAIHESPETTAEAKEADEEAAQEISDEAPAGEMPEDVGAVHESPETTPEAEEVG